jgi:hypothetical protein
MRTFFHVFGTVCFLWGALHVQGQTLGLLLNTEQSFDGYTLLMPLSHRNTYLIDNCGYLVHRWTSQYTPGQVAFLADNGNLVRTCFKSNGTFSGGGSGGRIEVKDWNDNLVWEYDYTGSAHQQHHDIALLPNGNVLILAWERITKAEAVALGRLSNLSSTYVWMEHVVEVKPTGTSSGDIVWEWHMKDHLIQDTDNTKPSFGVVADHPELVDINAGASGNSSDWMHCNAIDYNPELDQILINSRSMNEFYIIDHSTTTAEAATHSGGTQNKGGDFLYRWGNPMNYDRGTSSDERFQGQHDAHWIPQGNPNAGKIQVFNNGAEGRGYSSIDILTPPANYTIEPGQAWGPTSLDWTYYDESNPSNFYSNFISGSQTLPNGNVLICPGASAELFEVTPDKQMVWHYQSPISGFGILTQGSNPQGTQMFRSYRYPRDFAGFDGIDLTPTAPIELNPVDNGCVLYNQTSAAHSPYVAGSLTLRPNPARMELYLDGITEPSMVRISDALGKTILTTQVAPYQAIPVQSLVAGVYFIQVNGYTAQRFLKL